MLAMRSKIIQSSSKFAMVSFSVLRRLTIHIAGATWSDFGFEIPSMPGKLPNPLKRDGRSCSMGLTRKSKSFLQNLMSGALPTFWTKVCRKVKVRLYCLGIQVSRLVTFSAFVFESRKHDRGLWNPDRSLLLPTSTPFATFCTRQYTKYNHIVLSLRTSDRVRT